MKQKVSTIMVLDTEPLAYQQLLEGDLTEEFQLHYESNPKTHQPCDALLARPDLAAQYLHGISSPPIWIQSTWAGIEPLISPLKNHPKTQLTGVKGIFGPLIAEYTFNYLLEAIRHSEDFRSNQKKRYWPNDNQALEKLGTLQNKTLCIIGCGSIGCHVAKVAHVFGMTVIGVTRSTPSQEQLNHSDFSNFKEISQDIAYAVSQADFVLACLPETDATRDIINADVFAAMKSTAIIVNVGRGASLNLEALVTALRSNQISAAILDVFPEEPLDPHSPLWEEPNLIITPHVAAASTPRDVVRIFLDNLSRLNADQPLRYQIDLEQGY